MTRGRLLVVVLAFVAALAGAAIGCRIAMPRHDRGTELHQLLHDNIDLDAAQDARLEALERQFAGTRHALEARLRADNQALAAAIAREHGGGPAVDAAIDRSHRTMGALQKATLAHVFAMRAVLRADQAEVFDRVVVKALTQGA